MDSVVLYFLRLSDFASFQTNGRPEKEASRYLIRRFCGENITYNPHGKPQTEGIFFNASHSGDYVVLALCDREIGVDIEKVRPIRPLLLRKTLSEEEQKIAEKEGFFKLWTLKESLLKCVGTGIVSDLSSVPAYPLGQKQYQGERFYCVTAEQDDYVLSLTVRGEHPFDIKQILVHPDHSFSSFFS